MRTRRSPRRRPATPQPGRATACVIYVRESVHKKEREKFSLESQEAACMDYAVSKGL